MLFAQRSPRARRAFTLVELLTVIVIIGILAGLVTAAAIRVQGTVKKTAHALELTQLEMALHAYKERFGEFPPDGLLAGTFSAEQLFKRHVRKAFPRCLDTTITTAWSTYGVNLRPENALAFWLGGVEDVNGNLNGFSANPADPFDLISTIPSTSRIGPFYKEFDFDRLNRVSAGVRHYYPTVEARQTANTDMAIRYYRANTGVVGSEYNHSPVAFKDSNTNGTTYINPKTFQILSPGLRGGSFVTPSGGNRPWFPAGPYDTDPVKAAAQLEMMSNFTGGTMEDAMP